MAALPYNPLVSYPREVLLARGGARGYWLVLLRDRHFELERPCRVTLKRAGGGSFAVASVLLLYFPNSSIAQQSSPVFREQGRAKERNDWNRAPQGRMLVARP